MCGGEETEGWLEAASREKGFSVITVVCSGQADLPQASADKRVEKAASFLFNQTWSCCVPSPDVQAAKGSDSLGRSKGEADKGGWSPGKPVSCPGPPFRKFFCFWLPDVMYTLGGGTEGLRVVSSPFPLLSNWTRFCLAALSFKRETEVLAYMTESYFEISIAGSVSGKCWEARNMPRGVCRWGIGRQPGLWLNAICSFHFRLLFLLFFTKIFSSPRCKS